MGKEAWSFAEARKAADALGLDIKDSTLQTQLSAGRREVDKIPALTKEQSDYLNSIKPKVATETNNGSTTKDKDGHLDSCKS
jgi:hypothetical protein